MPKDDLLEAHLPPHPRPRLQEIGFRLRERMQELDLSGAELARKLHISSRQLNHYLHGRRSPDLVTAKRLATHLDMSLDDLVDPRGFLSHRDDRTYAALRRFHEVCTDLDPPDVGLVADVAESLAVRRRQEGRAVHTDAEISPVCDLLMRVHFRLIPMIIQRFGVTLLETVVLHRDDDNLWIAITAEFGQGTDRTHMTTQLVELATQRLGIGKDQVIPRRSGASNSIAVEIRLGQKPADQIPTKPRRGRAAGRGNGPGTSR